MKVELLRLGAANKPSPISEGVTEIQVNSQPCKGINLTTRHTQARRAAWVTTIHDKVKETIRAHHTLVHVFHAYASVDTLWVAHALSHYTSVRYGRIASVSAIHDTTQFGGSICPICVSTFKCLFIWTKPTRALTDTGGGYHLGALNIRSDYSPSFPSSILHFFLIVPSGLQLCHSINYSSSQYSALEPGYKSPKSREWNLPLHSTSTKVLSAMHSTTNRFSSMMGLRWYTKGIMHSRVSFNSYNLNAQIK
jgi:hypothetical protein